MDAGRCYARCRRGESPKSRDLRGARPVSAEGAPRAAVNGPCHSGASSLPFIYFFFPEADFVFSGVGSGRNREACSIKTLYPPSVFWKSIDIAPFVCAPPPLASVNRKW